jgi:signal transduction histidine kinase
MATAADDRFFRNMVTNMRNGVLAIDREGRVVMINEEACRILEIAPDAEDTGATSICSATTTWCASWPAPSK